MSRSSGRFHREEAGLTRIELVIVVIIIAVLAGVIAVNLNGVVANSKLNSLKGNLSALQTAVDAFSTNKTNELPTATGGTGVIVAGTADENGKQFVESYIHAMPSAVCTDWGVSCVTGGSQTWEVSANGKAYFKSTTGATTLHWYLPDQVTAAGTATAP